MIMTAVPRATLEIALMAAPALVRSGAEGAVMLPEGLSWAEIAVELVCCMPVVDPEAEAEAELEVEKAPLVVTTDPVAARIELVWRVGLPRLSVVEMTVAAVSPVD